jgi:hypothetical protein
MTPTVVAFILAFFIVGIVVGIVLAVIGITMGAAWSWGPEDGRVFKEYKRTKHELGEKNVMRQRADA